MGLLDPTLLRNLKGLTGLLAETPIGKYVRGKDQGVSVEGLKRGLLSIPVFENTPEANQTAYEAAMNIGPLGLGKIVYHGSPHKFDKFDASKIGTGEGAQAYGHGVYLADSPAVAEGYRLAGAGVHTPSYLNGTNLATARNWLKEAEDAGLTGKDAVKWAKEQIHNKAINTKSDQLRQSLYDTINNFDYLISGKLGALYKADLPDEWIPKMLDWDKPLKDQPESVRSALAGFDAKALGYKQIDDPAAGRMWTKDGKKRIGDSHLDRGGGKFPEDIEGRDILSSLSMLKNNREAVNYLRDLGIPGIRYLDGGSRGKGQGSYNYVVFPGLEDQVKILERNGVPLGLLGGK